MNLVEREHINGFLEKKENCYPFFRGGTEGAGATTTRQRKRVVLSVDA